MGLNRGGSFKKKSMNNAESKFDSIRSSIKNNQLTENESQNENPIPLEILKSVEKVGQ